MSFFRKKQSKEGQQKYEHQIYLAQADPGHIVDVSGCDLGKIPHGLYSMCKVLLKQALILHTNRLRYLKEYNEFEKLKDTIRILDLHANDLVELPSQIGQFHNLQVLNCESNALKTLPTEITNCHSLQTLNLKGNRLDDLPDDMGNIRALRSLDISDNHITRLPKSMANLRCLEMLILDADHMKYPPNSICTQGREAIMRFLCDETGTEYAEPSQEVLGLLNNPAENGRGSDSVDNGGNGHLSTVDQYYQSLANAALQFEKIKAAKRLEQARMQQEILEAQSETAELIAGSKSGRDDLLNQISQDQRDMETQLKRVQVAKDDQRRTLMEAIEEMESHATNLIGQIIAFNHDLSAEERRHEAEEQRRMEEEQYFRVRMDEYERLRKAEVEEAMSAMMAANLSLADLQDMHDRQRESTVNQVMEETLHNESTMDDVLNYKDELAGKLLNQLLEDQQFQKDALLALMEQKDLRCNRINHQIYLIQEELSQLSELERRNKDVKADQSRELLENQRIELTKLMMQLLEEKDDRNEELKKRLVEMERVREDDQTNYWMVQYQKLMETKPDLIVQQEQQLDTEVIKILEKAEAQEFIPAFARHRIDHYSIHTLTEEDLQKIGIYQIGLRRRILQLIAESEPSDTTKKLLDAQQKSVDSDAAEDKKKRKSPSAPPAIVVVDAAADSGLNVTAHYEMECVICLEKQCVLVFIPCGHVCSCQVCGRQLTECPLCRATIKHKVDITKN